MTDFDSGVYLQHNATVVDLLDRLLDRGVVLAAEVTLAVADIDLVHVSLRALVATSDRALRLSGDPSGEGQQEPLAGDGPTGGAAPLSRHG